MFDKDLVLETLRQVDVAAEKILTRFATIKKVSDFTDSPSGMEKMDSFIKEIG